jgi:hypothetical protein
MCARPSICCLISPACKFPPISTAGCSVSKHGGSGLKVCSLFYIFTLSPCFWHVMPLILGHRRCTVNNTRDMHKVGKNVSIVGGTISTRMSARHNKSCYIGSVQQSRLKVKRIVKFYTLMTNIIPIY